MSNSTCQHYTGQITGSMGPCRGCGAIVVNPNSVEAQQTGLVTTGKTATVAFAGTATAPRTADKIRIR